MSARFQTRRAFLCHAASGLILTGSSLARAQSPTQSPAIVWHDVRDIGVEGKGWTDTAKYYDRLPARAEGRVPEGVWMQSRHSAGMFVSFRTDATEICTDHVVSSSNLSVPDLAAIGMSGLDLYATDGNGDWKWLSVTRPRTQAMKGVLINGLAPGERQYKLYLPLYNGTESLKIGIPAGSSFTHIAPRTAKPIVFYGTSITQGASASRPGMPHVAILGRRLDVPVINLGFGGAGKMEPEVGELLTELDPAVYVIDCLPNMNAREVSERALPLVEQLRRRRAGVPVVLVEDRTYANAQFLPARQRAQAENRQSLQKAFQSLQQSGMKNLFYIEGDSLLGQDREDTSDSSHPTDLGFWRQAERLEPVLRAGLAAAGS